MRMLCPALLLLAAAPSLAAGARFDDTLRRHLAAIDKRDLDGILATVADGDTLRLVLPDGTLMTGKRAFADLHREWFAARDWKMTTREISRTETPDLAGVLLEATLVDLTPQGEANRRQNHLFLLFRRIDGEWKLVHDQNTRLPAPASR